MRDGDQVYRVIGEVVNGAPRLTREVEYGFPDGDVYDFAGTNMIVVPSEGEMRQSGVVVGSAQAGLTIELLGGGTLHYAHEADAILAGWQPA